MSRIFLGQASEGYVQSVSSDAQVTAFSFAAWINITDLQLAGGGGTVFVKDPTNSYKTYMEILGNGTVYAVCGEPSALGSVQTAVIAVPGTGYAHDDTGFFVGPNPDIPANLCEYKIGGAPGGIPTNPIGILASGTGYAVGQTYTTVTGGGQPGTGSGLTVLVTAVNGQSQAISQSVESVVAGVWTHVAMTWDSAGDGLVHSYINGVECTYQNERTLTTDPDISTGPYVFGDDLGAFTLDALIAEAVVCGDTALSGAQVASLAASTTGVPAPLLAFVTDYWHFCGNANPEPNVQNPANVGTVLNAAKGANSPGYSGCTVAVATGGSVAVGSYGGKTLAEAFYNPDNLDLLQVINEGGDVVWNLTHDGTATANPGSSTHNALLGVYFGETFALAFPNPYSKDVLQIIGPGDTVEFWVDSTGAAHP